MNYMKNYSVWGGFFLFVLALQAVFLIRGESWGDAPFYDLSGLQAVLFISLKG
jgi:hypothetical protein